MNELLTSSRGDDYDQLWTPDSLGNWSDFNDDGTAQTRTVNAANEIQTVNGDSTVTYDLAGNMTSDGTLDYQYDAWNRLVRVTAPEGWYYHDNHVDSADYAYDGLGRRIEKAVHASGSGYLSPLDDYYYNQNWQMLEDLGGSLAVPCVSTTDYLWSPRYQDAPIVAWHHSLIYQESDSACYYTTDANHNVTATIDGATGNVVNRYSYTAYGKATQYDASWSNAAAPTGDGPLYCGYLFDAETANYSCRIRYLSTAFGTFINRDPIGYEGGINLYEYVGDNPADRIDPRGLDTISAGSPDYNSPPPSIFNGGTPTDQGGALNLINSIHNENKCEGTCTATTSADLAYGGSQHQYAPESLNDLISHMNGQVKKSCPGGGCEDVLELAGHSHGGQHMSIGSDTLDATTALRIGNALKPHMCSHCVIILDSCNIGNATQLPALLAKGSGCTVIATGGYASGTFFDDGGGPSTSSAAGGAQLCKYACGHVGPPNTTHKGNGGTGAESANDTWYYF